MMRRTSGIGIAVGVWLALAPRVSRGETGFVWSAPVACPDAGSVVARMHAPGRGSASAVVEPAGGRWRAHLVVVGPGGERAERELEAASCEAIADAVALIVDLAAGPPARPAGAGSGGDAPNAAGNADLDRPTEAHSVALAAGVEGGGSEGPPGASVRGVEPGAAVRLEAHGVAEARTSGPAVGVASVLDFGALPAPAPGVALTAAWRSGALAIGVGAAIFASEDGAVAGSASGASVALTTATVDACWLVRLPVPPRDRLVVVSCAGAAVERFAAGGFGAPGTFLAEDHVAVVPAAVGGADLEWWPATRVGVRVGARALAPLTRPSFVVRGPGGGEAHRPAALAFEPSAGVVVRFDK